MLVNMIKLLILVYIFKKTFSLVLVLTAHLNFFFSFNFSVLGCF